MPVQVDDRGHLAGHLLGLVEKGDGLEPGHDLVAQLAQAIALARGDDPEILEPGRRVDPLLRPAVEHDVAEQLLA